MKVENLDEIAILFRIFDNNPGNCLLNHIILLSKQVKYYCRVKNIKPTCSLLKAKIAKTGKIELMIAKKKKKKKNQFIITNGKYVNESVILHNITILETLLREEGDDCNTTYQVT